MILNLIPFVLHIIFLIVGLVLCAGRFREGVYFFSILLFVQAYRVVIPYFRDDWMISRSLPLGMSPGELLASLTYLPIVLKIIALSLLVYGLAKNWGDPASEAK